MQINKITSGKLGNNTYFVTNNKKECLLIDCSCTLEQIIEQTKDYKILGVLLTHGHYDHFETLSKVIKNFNVKCYVSNLDYEKLNNPKSNYSIIFNTFYALNLPEENFELLDKNEDSFKLGSFNINYFLTPGHTNGSLCYLINNEALFTGDTLFAYSYGRTDLITGSEEDMANSLKFLTSKFVGSKIYPGHGKVGTIE